jgi:superoxide reductase
MDKLDLYKCDICGNIVEVLLAGGGELVCCSQPMTKLEAKNCESAMEEKHVPIFVKSNDNTLEVRVGEVLHPMSEEHHIEFIETISDDKKRVNLQFLNIDDEAKMSLESSCSKNSARAYCNLHGLWKSK